MEETPSFHATAAPKPLKHNELGIRVECRMSAGFWNTWNWGESWFFISKLAIQHLPSQIICMERMISCDIPANLSVWLSKGELCFPPRNEHILRVLGILLIVFMIIYECINVYQCILMYINVQYYLSVPRSLCYCLFFFGSKYGWQNSKDGLAWSLQNQLLWWCLGSHIGHIMLRVKSPKTIFVIDVCVCEVSTTRLWEKLDHHAAGWWPTPLKILVSWHDYYQYMEK